MSGHWSVWCDRIIHDTSLEQRAASFTKHLQPYGCVAHSGTDMCRVKYLKPSFTTDHRWTLTPHHRDDFTKHLHTPKIHSKTVQSADYTDNIANNSSLKFRETWSSSFLNAKWTRRWKETSSKFQLNWIMFLPSQCRTSQSINDCNIFIVWQICELFTST